MYIYSLKLSPICNQEGNSPQDISKISQREFLHKLRTLSQGSIADISGSRAKWSCWEVKIYTKRKVTFKHLQCLSKLSSKEIVSYKMEACAVNFFV